jgi:5-formyltetrahydrofolate cyclo-ligase
LLKQIVDVRDGKQTLRAELLAQRRQFSNEFIITQSNNMAERLYLWPLYTQAKVIMLFLSMPDEPQMSSIIERAWQQGKTVCVPHLRQQFGVMDAAKIDNIHDVVRGRFNLLVPDPTKVQVVAPALIDLIVVPAVAYDHAGNRLGMGAGYYDRFIPEASQAVTIGMVWSSHIINSIPVNQYDQPVQYLLTAESIIHCAGGKK